MKISLLKDSELLKRTKDLVDEERRITAELLNHLREIERRKLYSELKCTSLFLYCIRVLKMSEASAQRRIDAMRLSSDFPEVQEKIKTGEISLSVASHVQKFFRNEDVGAEVKKSIVSEVSGKSSRETERVLLSHSKEPERHIPESVKPVSATHCQVQFTASDEQLALFEKAKGLLAHAHPQMNYSDLFEAMARIVIKTLDPSQRSIPPTRKQSDPLRRRPNTSLEYEVWVRDEGKCVNCGSIYAPEGDHRTAWAKGGLTTKENLMILCRSCNQRAAIRQSLAWSLRRQS